MDGGWRSGILIDSYLLALSGDLVEVYLVTGSLPSFMALLSIDMDGGSLRYSFVHLNYFQAAVSTLCK
jgi:hypothetical protein